MNYKKVLAFCFVVFSISLIPAGYELGNKSHEISKVYGENSSLLGLLNISFESQALNSFFLDSEGNNATLKEILDSDPNKGLNFSCDTIGCLPSYSSLEEKTSGTFNLNEGEELIIGFKFLGEIEKINSISYSLQSNAPSSCTSQFKVDFLNDNSSDYSNTKALSEFCDNKNTGCYIPSTGGEEIKISTTPFCQKIEIPETPQVEIGTWIKVATKGTDSISMALYDLGGNEINHCGLEKVHMNLVGSEVSCLIDYAVLEPKEYYVCVYSSGGNGDYKTKGYIGEDNCGFYGSPIKNATASYYLFAKGKKFDAPGTINISNYLGQGKYASSLAEDYIESTYGNLNCEKGCYVPIKIQSDIDQAITISNVLVNSDKGSLPGILSNKFYTLNETPAKINMPFNDLSLNGLFNLPSESKKINYSLFLEGEKLFEEEIEIKNVSITLNPTIAPAGLPTNFEVKFYSDMNVTNYFWIVNNTEYFETKLNEKTLIFEEETIYPLQIIIETEGEVIFSKRFNIEVNSPKETIKKVIEDLILKQAAIKVELDKLDYALKDYLKQDLNWDNISAQIALLEQKYEEAKITENYSSVIPYLNDFHLPEKIIPIESSALSYYPSEYSIDVETVSLVFGDLYNFSQEEDYQKAIVSYNLEEYNTKISSKEITYLETGVLIPFVIGFYPKISDLNGASDSKLFIKKDNRILLNKETQEEGNYYVLNIDEAADLVIFAEPTMKSSDLSFFLAPSLNYFSIINKDEIEEFRMNWWIIFLALLVVFGVGLMFYSILHKWYDRKYEKRLFPDKNNLFNLITYINNQKTKGASESEIRKKLHKARWSSEQIRFVIRKYLGKNTGMWKPGDRKLTRKERRMEKNLRKRNKEFHNEGIKQVNAVKQPVSQMRIQSRGKIKTRKIGLMILWTILTLGIYLIYWIFSTSKELKKIDKSAPGLGLILSPILVVIGSLLISYLLTVVLSIATRGFLFAFITYGTAFILSLITYWKYCTAHETVTRLSKGGLFILFILLPFVAVIIAQVYLNKVSKLG